MHPIDSVQVHFNPGQLFVLNLCLAFIMFGVALDLRIDNFSVLFRKPKAPIVGLSSQLVLLPILTLALVFLFRPAPSIALGMLLVAACPGGNVSNFAVHLARGNAALSVLMTTISTLGAVAVTPLYFAFLAPLVPGSQDLRHDIYVNPLDMVSTIVQLILIPLAIGMFVHYRFPRLTARIQKPIQRLSILIFLGFVVFAIHGNFDNIVRYLHIIFLLVLVHNASALFTGYWWARANRLPIADARAISLETGIQNSGLGLILIFNFFHGLGGMAMIAAWWGVWHLVSAFTMAMLWRRRQLEIA
ncbi:MAG: bile acid:sodium symporter family protein [Phaeodactylibacter sp.]|nr:bile acid:sodium symporter family protein [Phaeodactylibacter sp.]MCB9273443.1 bile acid:sodium symporter family protein [Lewinellaceae bacterium]